jgi:hypothetical protein
MFRTSQERDSKFEERDFCYCRRETEQTTPRRREPSRSIAASVQQRPTREKNIDQEKKRSYCPDATRARPHERGIQTAESHWSGGRQVDSARRVAPYRLIAIAPVPDKAPPHPLRFPSPLPSSEKRTNPLTDSS